MKRWPFWLKIKKKNMIVKITPLAHSNKIHVHVSIIPTIINWKVWKKTKNKSLSDNTLN